MIKLLNFEENFIKEDEGKSKEDFKELYKKISHGSDYYSKGEFNRFQNLKKQLVINSVLQSVMDSANKQSNNEKITPFNREKVGNVIHDKALFKEELLKKGINPDGFDIESYSLDEIRSYLYNSLGIKVKSISDMYDNEINNGRYININFAELLVQGINPDSIRHKDQKPYIDTNFITKNYLLDKIVIDGQIFGMEVLNKSNKKIK